MSISDMTALKLGRRIQSGDITAVQAAEVSLARTKTVEPSVRAFVTVNGEKTMEQAGKVQIDVETGRLKGPLAGIPMAIKDNTCTKGMRTTCSSRILRNFIPTYTIQAVSSLEQAGAAIPGKTSMDEFAMGSTTETSAFGVTRSPWNLEHVPEGSSGGSCVVVAAGGCFYALGSDTGGSIRRPGSFCGATGIKPTYGAVSRYGLIAYGSSLDQIEPVTKDVSDYAAILEVLTSHDPKGGTLMERRNCDFVSALSEDVRGVHIDIPESYSRQRLDQEVKDTVLEAARVLGEKGAIVKTFGLKLAEYTIPAYYVIASTETGSNLSRLNGVKYGYQTPEYEGLHGMYKKNRSLGFRPGAKRRIMLGSFVLNSGCYSAYYLKALHTEALIKRGLDHAFASYDIILAPAVPSTTPRLGQSLGDPLKIYLGDICTISVDLASPPGINPPCGLDPEGPPIGLQLIGDCFKEGNIIRVAYAYEKTREWKLSPLATGKAKEPSGALTGRVERKSHK